LNDKRSVNAFETGSVNESRKWGEKGGLFGRKPEKNLPKGVKTGEKKEEKNLGPKTPGYYDTNGVVETAFWGKQKEGAKQKKNWKKLV